MYIRCSYLEADMLWIHVIEFKGILERDKTFLHIVFL